MFAPRSSVFTPILPGHGYCYLRFTASRPLRESLRRRRGAGRSGVRGACFLPHPNPLPPQGGRGSFFEHATHMSKQAVLEACARISGRTPSRASVFVVTQKLINDLAISAAKRAGYTPTSEKSQAIEIWQYHRAGQYGYRADAASEPRDFSVQPLPAQVFAESGMGSHPISATAAHGLAHTRALEAIGNRGAARWLGCAWKSNSASKSKQRQAVGDRCEKWGGFSLIRKTSV